MIGFQSVVYAVLQRDEACGGRIISGEFGNEIIRKKGRKWMVV